jgi:8-oxo-dGTP pyrophosphatase MutT (NUDIX family)
VNLRQAVRALVVDDHSRIVLVRFEATLWAAPGGGVDAGEDDRVALARELHEELGLVLQEPLGQPVWTRTHLFPMSSWDGQAERFYLLRVPPFRIQPAMGHAALEAEGVREVRWWSLTELQVARDVVFAPRRLPELLVDLLSSGPPQTPVDVGV